MTIYDYVKKQETKYQKPIQLEDGWYWSMKDHLRRSFLYLNSQFEEENENRDLRPNKNIVLGIINAQNRTMDFNVKDIELYVDDPDEYYKSFLIDKYHDEWALENKIDTFIDEMISDYNTYGGVLVRDTDEARPEVIDLRSLAFCNQTDILAYPFSIKHKFSPAELRETKWDKVEDIIILNKKEAEDDITIYEVIGIMPTEWLGDVKTIDENKKDTQQIQVVAFYKDQNNNEQGITLFKSKLPKLPFKFCSRDEIIGRARGRVGVEELFETQIWTNWSEVKITEMLDSASKTLFKSTDPSFKTRQNLRNVDNNEVLTLQEGRDIAQLDTYPRNIEPFLKKLDREEAQAQRVGSVSEGMLGETPTAGMPFKLFEAQQIEAKGMSKFRQGKIATFLEEIYRECIIPHLAKEIVKDKTFLAELSSDEMMDISDKVITNYTNDFIIKKILEDNLVPEEVDAFREVAKMNFMKSPKKFFKILKGEFKDKKLKVHANIAGKQKNLFMFTDKLVALVRQIIASPQILQDPYMVKLLNTILESSGLSPILFGASKPQMQGQMQGGTTEPLKQLGQMGQMQNKQMAIA